MKKSLTTLVFIVTLMKLKQNKISFDENSSENETLNKKDVSESSESTFRRKNFIGEDVISDSLIVFDDITMAIERSKDFVNFLTICRKLGYMYANH